MPSYLFSEELLQKVSHLTLAMCDEDYRRWFNMERIFWAMDTEEIGYFRQARKTALMSPHPEFKIGAVVCNKKPISWGCNQYEKTDPTVTPWDEGRQARLCAERHACKGVPDANLKGAVLYIWRETPGRQQALAHPCPSCVKFLIDKGLKRVYYTTDIGYDELDLSAP